jgi:hypothetical protein
MRVRGFVVSLLVLAIQVGVARGAAAQTVQEVIIEWNRILLTTILTPGTQQPTVFFPRPYAILHVAMFDAVNSIDFTYRPYAVRASFTGSPSREVAVAKAARDTMAAMFPSQVAVYDAALAATTARVSGDALTQGLNVGAAAAQAILALRANDGWVRASQVTYLNPNLPGYWQPVPPQNAAAAFYHYQEVLPFAIGSRNQFFMEAPPALTSQLYADDFNEVKRLGGANSTERTALQTQIAQTWAGAGYALPPQHTWYNVTRDLARARNLNGVDTARTFALLAITMHDALLTSFTGKFVYGLWRPTTAVREAGRDNNPNTEADPTFVSLLPTPPYPSYPGNVACIGGSSSMLLTRIWGQDNVPFSITWPGVAPNADVTRSYNGFRQAADEGADSRIYGGIHFRFDHPASFGACSSVANYVFGNYLTTAPR